MIGITNVSDDTFGSEVMESDVPVLVDFWAEWCGPCKAISAHIESISTDLAGQARVVKMNVDECTVVPGEYGIRSIPTLLVFKGGQMVDQMVGNPGSKSKILDLIKKHIDS